MIAGLKPYAEMKDSGIPWLGRLPAHWHVSRGKHLFRKMDRPIREDHEVVTCFRDGVVTLRKNRRLRGFTESLKEIGYQGIQEGDLVIHAMDAFAGAIGVADSDGKGTPVYSVCSPSVDANPYYFAYLLREMARSQWIQALAKGIRERSTDFRFEAFGNQLLSVPPMDEQAAIVRFLDHADRRIRRAIAAKQKLIRLLEEQKQAIIQRAVTRGLDPDVRFKPSGVEWLGDVPEHWQVLSNQRIFKEKIRSHKGQQEIPLSLSQRSGLIASVEMQERSLKTSSYESWKVTIPGDLVLNRFKAHLGVFFASNLRGIVSFHYGVFVPRLHLATKYFELLYHTTPYRTIYAGRSNGMTVGLQNLSNQNFYGVKSVFPPIQEQLAIVEFVRSATQQLERALDAAFREMSFLREYRTRLIADIVTGKLDVREAAARLPESPEPELADDEALDTEGDDDASLDEAIAEDAAA